MQLKTIIKKWQIIFYKLKENEMISESEICDNKVNYLQLFFEKRKCMYLENLI